jgi:hypothetical protein
MAGIKAQTCCTKWQLIIKIELWTTIYVLLSLSAWKGKNAVQVTALLPSVLKRVH